MKKLVLSVAIATLASTAAYARANRAVENKANAGKAVSDPQSVKAANARSTAEAARILSDVRLIKDASARRGLEKNTALIENNTLVPAKLLKYIVDSRVIGEFASEAGVNLTKILEAQKINPKNFYQTLKNNLEKGKNDLYTLAIAELIGLRENPEQLNNVQRDVVKSALFSLILELGTNANGMPKTEVTSAEGVLNYGIMATFISKGISPSEVIKTFENIDGMNQVMREFALRMENGESAYVARDNAMRDMLGEKAKENISSCNI